MIYTYSCAYLLFSYIPPHSTLHTSRSSTLLTVRLQRYRYKGGIEYNNFFLGLAIHSTSQTQGSTIQNYHFKRYMRLRNLTLKCLYVHVLNLFTYPPTLRPIYCAYKKHILSRLENSQSVPVVAIFNSAVLFNIIDCLCGAYKTVVG